MQLGGEKHCECKVSCTTWNTRKRLATLKFAFTEVAHNSKTDKMISRGCSVVTREVKHDVYGKRQTAKIILILLTFSLALK